MILGSELGLKKVQTAVSKHLGILPKIRGGGKFAKFWVKTACFRNKDCLLDLLDLHVVWWLCEIFVFSLFGYLSIWLSTASSKIYILYFF